jgi:hypothetical protein
MRVRCAAEARNCNSEFMLQLGRNGTVCEGGHLSGSAADLLLLLLFHDISEDGSWSVPSPARCGADSYRGGSSCQWGQARGHQLGSEAKRGFGSAQPEPVVVIPLRSPSRCDARTAVPSAAAAFEFWVSVRCKSRVQEIHDPSNSAESI